MLLIIPFLVDISVYANVDESVDKNDLKRNINKIGDVTKIKISDFKWKQKTKGTVGILEYLVIHNTTKVKIKDIRVEVLVYDRKGILSKFLIPINGEIEPGTKRRFNSIMLPILGSNPEKTIINTESAKMVYLDDQIKIRATNAIEIKDFTYIIEKVASKTILVKELKYINNSKNYFKNITFSINFYDQRNNIIESVPFNIRGVIGPEETKIQKNFQIPGVNIDYFSRLDLTVFKGSLISPKEYLGEGGDTKFVNDSFSDYSSPVPKEDLKINDFVLTNTVKNTIGLMDIDFTNNSRFEYKDIVLLVGFENESGNTTTQKKIKIKKLIQPYSSQRLSNIEFGLIDNDFSNLRLSVLSAKMISEVTEITKKVKDRPDEKIKKELLNLDKFELNDELIVLNVNIGNMTSIRVLNISDYTIYNPIFKINLIDEKSKIIKSVLLKGEGPVDSKKERTYRSIKFADFNSFTYVNYELFLDSAERLK